MTYKEKEFIAKVYRNKGYCSEEDKQILEATYIDGTHFEIDVWCTKHCPMYDRTCHTADAYRTAAQIINNNQIDFVEILL